jgi:hypothetical protein
MIAKVRKLNLRLIKVQDRTLPISRKMVLLQGEAEDWRDKVRAREQAKDRLRRGSGLSAFEEIELTHPAAIAAALRGHAEVVRRWLAGATVPRDQVMVALSRLDSSRATRMLTQAVAQGARR